MINDLERDIMASELGQSARLDQQPLIMKLVGDIRGVSAAQSRERLLGFVVHQIDDRQSRRHLGARGALQATIDLIPQKIGRLI
jgi:hypothetical protein